MWLHISLSGSLTLLFLLFSVNQFSHLIHNCQPGLMSAFTSFSGKTRAVADDTALRQATFSEIPIISLTSPLPELIEQLRNACTKVGFFYIKDHGVPQKVIDDTFKCAENFFSLEREVKDEVHYKKSSILRGFEPPAEVRTDETKKADMNEAFNWGYSPELDPTVLLSDQSIPSRELAKTELSTWKKH